MGIRRKKSLIEQATDYVEAAVEKAGPILADAKDQVGAMLADAKDQAGPALAEAKAKAGPTLVDARDKATPLIAQSAAMAAEKASKGADLVAVKAAQGKELTAAKAAELTGRRKKKHRLRTFLLLGGFAALAGVLLKKMRDNAEEDDWQPSYPEPPLAATASHAKTSDEADAEDEGGAGPDEALADAADADVHEVTTPDDPAEVVDIADEPAAKQS